MLNSSRIWCGLVAALVMVVATPAFGQRVQFPSPDPSVQGPPVTFDGTVQPAPAWDPYSPATTTPKPYYAAPPPGAVAPQQPPALFPSGVPWRQDPGTYAYPQPNGGVGQWQRFLKEIRFETTWLAGDHTSDNLDINTVELNATFAVPFFYNTESPLLVTPGFAVHYFEGPVTLAALGPDLPPRVYDAYLDLGWQPLITPWLTGDLGIRTGVYSDFEEFNSSSFRIMGRALGLLAFTPTTQVALGIIYLDRNDVKLLPAGGVIWRPNPDTRYDILFPNPKLAHRMSDIGTMELWWYVGGEYGGGAWTVQRVGPPPFSDAIDYNDIRVILGLEWILQRGLRGHFEIGYVFDREIVFVGGPPANFKPDDTVMLRGGITY